MALGRNGKIMMGRNGIEAKRRDSVQGQYKTNIDASIKDAANYFKCQMYLLKNDI